MTTKAEAESTFVRRREKDKTTEVQKTKKESRGEEKNNFLVNRRILEVVE